MMKLLSKSLMSFLLLLVLFSSCFAGNSNQNDFELIPEAEGDGWKSDVEELGDINRTDEFFDTYNQKAEGQELGEQVASGIMNRDTILKLLTQVVGFISNAALIVGAGMIVYAGYLYVTSVYTGDNAAKAKEAIKWAVIGVVIVVFSYAVIRIVIKAFL